MKKNDSAPLGRSQPAGSSDFSSAGSWFLRWVRGFDKLLCEGVYAANSHAIKTPSRLLRARGPLQRSEFSDPNPGFEEQWGLLIFVPDFIFHLHFSFRFSPAPDLCSCSCCLFINSQCWFGLCPLRFLHAVLDSSDFVVRQVC